MTPRARSMGAPAVFAVLALMTLAGVAAADPFIWDQDGDRIDDRLETVNLLGFSASFENGDSLARQRFEVTRTGGGLVYGMYVVYMAPPTTTDFAALAAIGLPVLHRIEAVPAVRSVGTFVQVAAAAALPGVERVEALPVLYPVVVDGAAASGVRDATEHVFPTWQSAGGGAGEGIVIAFLDTGINDAADGGYPGHESVAGRFVGGAEFTHADSTIDTQRSGSANPEDHGGIATGAHATHVAGIALGTGGSSAFATGIAPAARFVDVKVLNDLGTGTGIAEALDWCVTNRQRDWGAGAMYAGIDVINLSLSSLDESDGQDLVSRIANRASELGVVVVAAMGNDAEAGFVPSPAAGDHVIAVGAYDAQRTPATDDDIYATFNNSGPRYPDSDASTLDEMKPDLLAPGVGVLSADGDASDDGTSYVRRSGTSMAVAFVSGAAAALLSDHPGLDPATLASALRATARRNLAGAPDGTTGADPRWSSTLGFGMLDLYAARLELDQPGVTQIRRLMLAGAGETIHAELWTQRERGTAHLVFERAADLSGVPGTFTPIDSVPAAGDSSLADPLNLTAYPRTWFVPEAERGVTYWYRAAWTENGVRFASPARRLGSPLGPSVGMIEVTIVHNAYDGDVEGVIEAGISAPQSSNPSGASVSLPLPGSTAAVETDWVNGISTAGNIARTFRIDIPAGSAEALLPASTSTPWFLRVTEGGLLNRSGRITRFRVTRYDEDGDQVTIGGPIPRQTIEGSTTTISAPPVLLGVDGPSTSAPGLRVGPNPARAGQALTFVTRARPAGPLAIFDVIGRRVAGAPFVPTGDGQWQARWVSRTPDDVPRASGIYFARSGAQSARFVLLPR